MAFLALNTESITVLHFALDQRTLFRGATKTLLRGATKSPQHCNTSSILKRGEKTIGDTYLDSGPRVLARKLLGASALSVT